MDENKIGSDLYKILIFIVTVIVVGIGFIAIRTI